jgi:hypothetical protein
MPNPASITNLACINNQLRLSPKFIARDTRIDRMSVQVVTAGNAGALFRPCIYADDGTFRPGSLVVDAGTIATDVSTTQPVATVNILLEGGRWYWFGGATQNAATTDPIYSCLTGSAEPCALDQTGTLGNYGLLPGFTQAGVSGAMPASVSGIGVSDRTPTIACRIANI